MLTVVAFEEGMLAEASALLAASQARNRKADPLLPASFEKPEAALGPLEETFRLDGARGVATVRDGKLAGFLLGVPRQFGGRVFSMPYHGHALAAGAPANLYREMYAALAPEFVSRGYFQHQVGNLAVDGEAQEAWDWLAFGASLVLAVRSTAEPVPPAPELDLRQAGPEAIEDVIDLQDANARHHSRSPLFNVYIQDLPAIRKQVEELLQDAGNGHLLAYEGGRPVGMNTFMMKSWVSPMMAPEKSIYLFQGIVYEEYRRGGVGRALLANSMRWAREQGYDWCTLHFFTANLPAAGFWISNGFRPLELQRWRLIDDRIAWAHG